MSGSKNQYRPTRRQFLGHACAAGVGGSIALAGSRAGASTPPARGRHFEDRVWEELVGDTFYASGSPFDDDARPAALVLREVVREGYEPGTELPPGVRETRYSLIFEVAGPDPIASATHILEHSRVGRFAAFLNPRPDPRLPHANLCDADFN